MMRGDWLTWEPPQNIPNYPENVPTKPTKSGFEGPDGNFVSFVSATLGDSQIFSPGPASAAAILNRTGTRLIGDSIGVWSDLDGPELRRALRIAGWGHLPVRYLDGANVPDQFKVRRAAGEPVPMSVLAAMEANPASPFTVRDRLLKEMGWKR